jgi:hypothetical protein
MVEEDFASSDDEEGDDDVEEVVEVAPRTGPRIKNASNAFVPPSKVEIKANMKKLTVPPPTSMMAGTGDRMTFLSEKKENEREIGGEIFFPFSFQS